MYRYKSILIIDDDEDDRSLFSDAVKQVDSALTCHSAKSGPDALGILKGGLVPDLIFLDLNMPCQDGKQCLGELKKINALKNTPVIMYSTTRRPSDVAETKKMGATHFITKPPLFNDICKAISGVLTEKWGKESTLVQELAP